MKTKPRFRVFDKERKVWLEGSFAGTLGDILINSNGQVFSFDCEKQLFSNISDKVELFEYNPEFDWYESKPDIYGITRKVSFDGRAW